MEPIYTPHNAEPAYQLNWALTIFWREPATGDEWLAPLQKAAEPDGVRVVKHHRATGEASQFFVSTRPQVSPRELIRSVKGRLQHAVRREVPKALRRNYCVRSVGSARRSVVENYVAKQTSHHPMADPRVCRKLAQLQKVDSGVDLSRPQFSSHGEYWYNLHVVFVNERRWMEVRDAVLVRLRDMIEAASAKHGYRLSRLGLLADHIHLTMGCPIERSPEDVALGLMNNCAYACEMRPMFQFGYYVGTFGEYDRGAVV